MQLCNNVRYYGSFSHWERLDHSGNMASARRKEDYPPLRQRLCFYFLCLLAVGLLVFCLYEQQISEQIQSSKTVEYKIEERISVNEFVIENKGTNVEPEHLLLTPFIVLGDIQRGKDMAKVKGQPGLEFAESYSGFLTVDAVTISNLFFWFFPAMNGDTSSAIIIWLQGGPGQSALFSVFNSNGPYRINSDLEITRNPFTWCESFNVLYIDNPVGTGFSFSSEKGYIVTQESVVHYLYIALRQFFELFPEYKENPVIISGEGYGAKYAVTLANMIHDMEGNTTFNLAGITLENPFLSVEVMFDYGRYLRKMGLINDESFQDTEYHLKQASQDIGLNLWSDAMDHWEQVFGKTYGYHSKEEDIAAIHNNILNRQSEPEKFNYYVTFLNELEVRRAIHVGRLKFQNGEIAYQALRNDVPQSIDDKLSILLDNYKVLFYGGSRDKKIPYSLSIKVLDKVNWRRLVEYQGSQTMIWKVNPNDHDYAGYFRQAQNFIEILVKDCGHVVAHEKPVAALDIISRFITNRAFNIEKLK